MKKIFKVLGVIVVFLLITLFTIPQFYKKEINAFIKEDINKNFNAIIDYQDVSLSLFKDFPNLQVKIVDITVDGVGAFKEIQLANIKDFSLSLNAKKVFLDKEFEIKSIAIDQMYLDMLVNKNGKANYDIVKESADATVKENTSFELKLKNYELTNSTIKYVDALSGMSISLKGINHFGNGKISDQAYLLDTKTNIKQATFDFGVKYINEASINLVSEILIENDYSKYTLSNSKFDINGLAIDITKSMIELKEQDIVMDIAFKTIKNEFNQLVSLIPSAFMSGVENLETNGTAILGGFVNGVYNENNFPAYNFDLKVTDAYLKYPDLPQAIKEIDVVANVNFKGGKNINNTMIDLPKIHFLLADNAVDGRLKVQNPMTDPLIQASFKSKIDFTHLKKAIKIPAINQIEGLLDADFSLDGRLSAIEKKQFDRFRATGFFNLKDFSIQSDSIPHDIAISKASMHITPAALKIKDFYTTIGENDFSIHGNINNYIAYLLNKDQVLKADFTMRSQFININDFMSDEKTEPQQTEKSGIIKIPKNLDINLIASAKALKYKDLGFKDVEGQLKLKEGIVNLQAILLKTMDGQMLLNGSYDSTLETPVSSFDIAMKKMSINKSATSFSAFQSYAPALQSVRGDFFSNMKMDVRLDEQMNPILNTVKASGDFNTKNIDIAGIKILQNIGDLVKIKSLSKPNIDNINAHFKIVDGAMKVLPFTFNLNGMQSAFEGFINLDKQIDFILSIDIPKDKLGANPNMLLEGIVGKLADIGLKTNLGDIIKMKFRIKGDYNHPKILPAIAGYEGNSTQEIIKEVIKDKVEKVVEEVVDNAREEAQKQADKLMAQAQTQADKLINKATNLATKLEQEAEKQGENLISKAAGNPFKKLAAEAAATKIKKEAKKKGVKLVDKARDKANKLLVIAQEKADKIVNVNINKNKQ